MKILHVTESLGAGVGHFLSMAIHGQVAAGHQVVLVHSIREDTPVDSLNERYAGVAERLVVPMVTAVSPWQDFKGVLMLARLMRQHQPDVVHLHSSKAGVLGRVAARLCGYKPRVFYSPHGFAFLREDVSLRKQRLFLWFEQLAAKLGGTLVACSNTEAELAKTSVRHPCVTLVENAADFDEVPASIGRAARDVLVLNAGRVCYQKAPWRFRAVAEGCYDLPANFVWMGSGELAAELQTVKNGTRLKLTGWLDRTEVAKFLSNGSVFLMPSLWEGMPLALIEAQVAGIPAVVPNVIGCKDVVEDGMTGYVCDDDAALLRRTRQLIEDSALRKEMGDNARRIARTRFSVKRLNDELLDLYTDHHE